MNFACWDSSLFKYLIQNSPDAARDRWLLLYTAVLLLFVCCLFICSSHHDSANSSARVHWHAVLLNKFVKGTASWDFYPPPTHTLLSSTRRCQWHRRVFFAYETISTKLKPYAKIPQHTNNEPRWVKIVKKPGYKITWHFPFEYTVISGHWWKEKYTSKEHF